MRPQKLREPAAVAAAEGLESAASSEASIRLRTQQPCSVSLHCRLQLLLIGITNSEVIGTLSQKVSRLDFVENGDLIVYVLLKVGHK